MEHTVRDLAACLAAWRHGIICSVVPATDDVLMNLLFFYGEGKVMKADVFSPGLG